MMYYAPRADNYLIIRLVASATAKTEIVDTGEEKTVNFSHVEISFQCHDTNQYFDNDKTIGFSIVQNSTMYFRLKSWREEYTAIRMYVDSMVYAKLYQTAWHVRCIKQLGMCALSNSLACACCSCCRTSNSTALPCILSSCCPPTSSSSAHASTMARTAQKSSQRSCSSLPLEAQFWPPLLRASQH